MAVTDSNFGLIVAGPLVLAGGVALVLSVGGTLLLTLSDEAATQIPVSRRRVPALKKALGL